MTAMIKLYTWWTIRQHKKQDQQAYKLVAVTRKNPVSGADRNQLKDILEVAPVKDETARKKMRDGAVIYGLLPAKFAFDFKFDSIHRNTVPGVFKANMYGVFSLNFEIEKLDELGGFLTLLPELCKSSKNEWSKEDLEELLKEYEPLIEVALKNRVNSDKTTSSELLGKGDSWTPTEEESVKVFPPWLKVYYLHTKFTYSEAELHGEKPANEEAESVQEDHLEWEKKYNKMVENFEREAREKELQHNIEVENFEREAREKELQHNIEIKEFDNQTKKHVLVLAKAEEQRNFFRSKHPELCEALDLWTTWRKTTIDAYANIFIWFAEHPIISPIILIAALLAYNYAANAFIPLRVQIRIDGNNDSAAKIMKDAIRKHFASANAEFMKGKRTNLTFSDKDGGRITNEFLLEREYISRFEESLENFIYNNQDCINGKYRSLPANYSLVDGGINFMLKKKVYTFTVKDNTIVRNQEVILSGNNSIGRDLKTFLARQYAEGGTVDDSAKRGNDTVFSFKLRSGITVDELKKGINAKFAVRVIGNDSLTIDARQIQTEQICLDVRNLSDSQIEKVEAIFSITFLRDRVMRVDDSRKDISEKIRKAKSQMENDGISGDWQGDTYVFKTSPKPQELHLRIVVEGDRERYSADFSKLEQEYKLNKDVNVYTFSYTSTQNNVKRARALVNDIEHLNYLRRQGEPTVGGNSTTYIYAVVEQVKIDVRNLSHTDRTAVTEILGGTSSEGTIRVDSKNLTSEKINELGRNGIDIQGRNAVKLVRRELRIVIQGTPNQATLNCLNRQGFQNTGRGIYVCKYYRDQEKSTKLDALGTLAPMLIPGGQDGAGYVYLQRQYVNWSAPGLPEVEKRISAIMKGHMEGYLAEDEIQAIVKQFPQYEVRREVGSDGIKFVFSRALVTYNVKIDLGISDDYEKICGALRKAFGKDLPISSVRGNPPYFSFKIVSPETRDTLQEFIYETIHSACSSVQKSSIFIRKIK